MASLVRMSRSTECRAIKRVKNSLAHTPVRRIQVLQVMNSSSCQEHLRSKGAIINTEVRKKLQLADNLTTSIAGHMAEVKHSGNTSEMKKHSYRLLKSIAKGKGQRVHYARQKTNLKKLMKSNLRIKKKHANWWSIAKKKHRSDRLRPEIRHLVKEFYFKAEVTRDVPNKKDVIHIKDEDSKRIAVEKQMLILTLHEAYELFQVTYPDVKISFSSFYKLKPRNVRCISETSRRSCLCTTCANLSLKAEALKKFFHPMPIFLWIRSLWLKQQFALLMGILVQIAYRVRPLSWKNSNKNWRVILPTFSGLYGNKNRWLSVWQTLNKMRPWWYWTSLKTTHVAFKMKFILRSSSRFIAGDDVPSSNTLSDSVERGSPRSTLSESVFELGTSSPASRFTTFFTPSDLT